MKPKILIVDEKDDVIGCKDRDAIKQSDIYRVSALWITNSKGDILLAQRAFTKSHDPGKWGPAVAGTVEEGESYEDNIRKEAEEEIGLRDIELQIGPKKRVSGEYNFFVQWHLIRVDKSENEFVFDKNEVEKVKWFSKEELSQGAKADPDKFLKNMKQWIEIF